MADRARDARQAPAPLIHEQLLIGRSANGDVAAFNELVILYRARVYRTAAGLVGPDAAEDVAEEAFLRAWRQLPSLRRRSAFRAWLDRITRNAAIDCLRARESALVSQDSAGGTAGAGAASYLVVAEVTPTPGMSIAAIKAQLFAAGRALCRCLGAP